MHCDIHKHVHVHVHAARYMYIYSTCTDTLYHIRGVGQGPYSVTCDDILLSQQAQHIHIHFIANNFCCSLLVEAEFLSLKEFYK